MCVPYTLYTVIVTGAKQWLTKVQSEQDLESPSYVKV